MPRFNKQGFFGCVYVKTAIVDLYYKLDDVETARNVFDKVMEKNAVSWNSKGV